ncbi:MAG: lysophospholipid acyltransferase family protein, partial [Aristaeellaceae bacterium]
MRTSMRALRSGEVLGIFPEGTRFHKGLMEEQEAGAAMIALRSGVPMIPMYIDRRLALFRPVTCVVGEPIPMDDLREKGINKETCQELMARITQTYQKLAQEAAQK